MSGGGAHPTAPEAGALPGTALLRRRAPGAEPLESTAPNQDPNQQWLTATHPGDFPTPRVSSLAFRGRNTISEIKMGIINVEIDSDMHLPKYIAPEIEGSMLSRETKNSNPPSAYAETIINRRTAIGFSGDGGAWGDEKRNLTEDRVEKVAENPKANVEVPMIPSARNGRQRIVSSISRTSK